jgi:predicted amino acid dehydrogenase
MVVALVNVKKKIEKASDKLGFSPGESVVAACGTNPKGTVNKMFAREMGGLAGSAAAGKTGKATESEAGLASRFPAGQMNLVLTDRRLFVASVSAMSGKPKEVVAEWDRSDVVDIHIEKGLLASPLSITFSDETVVLIEGAKGTNPAALANADLG